MDYIGVQSLITIFSHLFFIGLSYWTLQTLRMDHFFKKGHPQQLRVILVLIAVAVGYLASSFFLDFMTHSQNLLLFLR